MINHPANLNRNVTVITPTIRGREEFLSECMRSVLKQKGGVPGHLIKLDWNNEGPASVRNELVSMADTEWILFLDDDDFLNEDYLEKIRSSSPYADVVYSWCNEEGFNAGLDREFNAEALRGANYIPVTACVRKSLFDQVGGFPITGAYEDWGLWIKLLDAGARFKCVQEKLWTYRRHDGSRTYENQRAIAAGEITEL